MNKELLTTLCSLDGVSGYENAVRDFILDELKKSTVPMDVQVDKMGNILVHLYGKESAQNILQLDAHMDEVGFIITHLCDNGMLRFGTIGGINDGMLFGHRVRIGNRVGVIGGKAMHQCKGDESKKVPSADGMYIDIGCSSKDEVSQYVSVGDTGTFDAGLTWMNDATYYGKAVDDRIGCLLLLELAMQQPARDVWLSFSTQEEIGLRGAGVATEAIRPDYIIAIDATTAADVAGNSGADVVCKMGNGAVVSFADRATLYDPALYQRIHRLAQENDIATQTKSQIAGGNNAGAMQRRLTGAYAATVSLPCRYIHSPTCMGTVADYEAMLKLITVLVEVLTR